VAAKPKPCIRKIVAWRFKGQQINWKMTVRSVLYSTTIKVDGRLSFWLTITTRYSPLTSLPVGIRTLCWGSIGSHTLGVSITYCMCTGADCSSQPSFSRLMRTTLLFDINLHSSGVTGKVIRGGSRVQKARLLHKSQITSFLMTN